MTEPDYTWWVISDQNPDPTGQIISDPDLTVLVITDPDPDS